MAAPEPGFRDYLKAAFFARKRVRGLGGIPVNVLGLLAVLVAGAIDPGFLLIGAGLEVAYLAWLTQNQRFRNLVRGERLREQAEGFAGRLEVLVGTLAKPDRARFGELEARCDRIREASSLLGAESVGNLEEIKERGVNSLLLIYARLLATRAGLTRYLAEAREAKLEQKLADATARLAKAESDAMRRSLESTADILRKRIEHQGSAVANLQIVDAELERIENQVDLIREELTVSRDPAALSARIDAIAGTIGDASAFLRHNQALLGELAPAAADPAPPVPAPRVRDRGGA